jgi:hypothetical protein
LGVSADDMGSSAREHGIREPEVQACSFDVEREMRMTGRAPLRRWRRAILDGHGDDDVSSVITESVGTYPSPGDRQSSSPA